jgi:D-serine deaminase-like pyridoxal phosphate-dependent protein
VGSDRLTTLLDHPIDWRHKGFPATSEPISVADVATQRWSLLAGDLLLPVIVLKESALEHNISLMARFCRDHGVWLAPHGKTTMAPRIFERQLDAGAWGLTAATVSQARIFRRFGVDRILLANEVVEPGALAWVAGELAEAPEFEFFCLVDSTEAVSQMTDALTTAGAAAPVAVLVELGLPGGRTGCRTIEEAGAVAEAVAGSPALELAGVEGFEGVIGHEPTKATLAAVDDFLRRIRTLTLELADAGAFAARDEILVTVGGSAFFDRVVDELATGWDLDLPVRLVLRSGCYVTHDSGFYERLSPLGARSGGGERLRPALEAWGVVLSRPEPELAIVGLGKRDVPYDLDLPVPRLIRGLAGELREARPGSTVTALNDQHAYLRLDGDDLAVGEFVGFGVSHPCTAFDKWALIPVVDDDYVVVDAVGTFF